MTLTDRMEMICATLIMFSIAYASGCCNDKPNFVIFLVDDMGFADLQVYGNPLSSTPNINMLARTGLKFTQFYSASSVGSPSRAALLTGRYPIRSGVWGNESAVFRQGLTGGLPHNEITIPEMLASQGYKSAHIGKWHLGVGDDREFLPLQHGFDRYFGVPHTHSDCPCEKCFYPDEPCNYDECAVDNAPCQLIYGNTIIEQPVDLIQLSDRQARAARSWIQEFSCSETPFFLLYAFQHTQVPQFAGERFRHTTIGGDYTDSLAELDWEVGEVLDELNKSGLRENTLVILTSDNGPDLEQIINGGFSGQMRCGRGSSFEGGHRVPTIMNWPGHIQNGISTKLLSHLDIWPTLRRLSGSLSEDFDITLDGFDFSDVLFSNKDSKRRSMLYYPAKPDPNVGPVGLRNNRYKILNDNCSELCENGNGNAICTSQVIPGDYSTSQHSYLLYDLLLDPEERSELANNTDYQSILLGMSLQMKLESSDVIFADSVLVDFDENSQLCCDPGCIPFPACCSCDSNYDVDLFPLDEPCKHD